MIKLSIIIVNYNTRKLVMDCIDSIFESNPRMLYEIIVVDNSSSDGSISDLRELKHKVKNLILIENGSNLGFARANNQAIKKAGGEYKLLLNSDTKVKIGAIEKLLNFAINNPNVGVVGPKFLNPDASVQGSCFRLPTVRRALSQYWFGKKGLLDKYSPSTEKPQEVEAMSMACLLITPKCIKEVGLINDKYFMYFEDLDYCRKVGKIGLKLYYLPSAEIIHYHGESGKSLVNPDLQWKRLIPSSKIYHGVIVHYMIYFVMRTSNICLKLSKKS